MYDGTGGFPGKAAAFDRGEADVRLVQVRLWRREYAAEDGLQASPDLLKVEACSPK